jgi:hypothetical protein
VFIAANSSASAAVGAEPRRLPPIQHSARRSDPLPAVRLMPALSLPGLASRLDCLALPSNLFLYQDVVKFEQLTRLWGSEDL